MDHTSQYSMLEHGRVENFSPEFRTYIDNLYGYHYSPEEILGYIYGVLYSPFYRKKYLPQLKMDFPRIPFTKSQKLFEQMSSLGLELIQTHLMKEIPDYGLGKYTIEGSDIVKRVQYSPEELRIYINDEQYFECIPKEVWDFYIGGYRVIDRYLKYRKDRTLTLEEIQHIGSIANILQATIEQMQYADAIYKEIDNSF